MFNLEAAWTGFFCGCIAGAVPGLFFHDPAWLGGYTSWPRRMLRLAHISFFGIGLLNLSLVFSSAAVGLASVPRLAGALLLVGAVSMPAVCYLSAWKAAYRHLFFLPALSVTLGVGLFFLEVIRA